MSKVQCSKLENNLLCKQTCADVVNIQNFKSANENRKHIKESTLVTTKLRDIKTFIGNKENTELLFNM